MKNTRKFARKFLDLQGSELICYKARGKRASVIFLHCLVGVYVSKLEPITIEDDQSFPIILDGSENTIKLYRLQIVLSPIQKRVLYFDKEEEADRWLKYITEAMGDDAKNFEEFYELQMTPDNLRGEGSFGKVYVGKCK